jgi:hypothetical protein
MPKKYKFQGTNIRNKAEVHIDSGTLGMEFFLERTLPDFNQAGTRLNWSWFESFLEFKNVLGDGYCTTWLKVLTNHFLGPLENKPKDTRELKHRDKKENFYRAISILIWSKPSEGLVLTWFYMSFHKNNCTKFVMAG